LFYPTGIDPRLVGALHPSKLGSSRVLDWNPGNTTLLREQMRMYIKFRSAMALLMALWCTELQTLYAVDYTFDPNGAGMDDWWVADNWSPGGAFPNSMNDRAIFDASALANYTTNVHPSTPYTVQELRFATSSGWTIFNNERDLVLQAPAGSALVTQNGSGGVTMNIDWILASNLTVGGTGSGTVTFNGSVLNGVGQRNGITGGFSLTKEGSFTLTLNPASTYSGGTIISAGTIVANNSAALGSGTVTLNGGTLNTSVNLANNITLNNTTNTIAPNGNYRLLSGQISGTGGFTVANGGGTPGLQINNPLNNWQGAVTINAGTYLRTSASEVIPNAVSVTNNGNLRLDVVGGGSETIAGLSGTGSVWVPLDNSSMQTLVVGFNNVGSTFSGTIGAGGQNNNFLSLQKIGSAPFYLDGNNVYGGLTTVSGGYLVARNNNALGTSNMGTIVQNGATLQLEHATGINIANEAVSIIGNGVGGTRGALASWSGANTWGGSVTMTGNSMIFVNSGSLAVNGAVGDGGNVYNLQKTGAGALTFGGVNTYTGTTTVSLGVLNLNASAPTVLGNLIMNGPDLTYARMQQPNQFGAGVVANFTSGSGAWNRFELFGNNQTLAGINTGNIATQGGGVIQNSEANGAAGANATLTLNGSGSYLFNGHLRDFGSTAAGTNKLSLTKEGTGTQTLVGNVITYSGSTTVNNGTLELYNTNAFNSATTVNAGGTLRLSNTFNISTPAGFNITLNNGSTLTHNGLTNGGDYLVLNGAVTVNGSATINQNSVTNTTGSNKNLFLDAGLKGSGSVTINAANPGNAVVFRNNNSTFAGSVIVNGIPSATVNLGSGIAVGGATTAFTNVDFTVNGTMELLNQGLGWAGGAPGDFWMGALNGNGVVVGNFTGGGETRVRVGNNNNSGSFSGVLTNGTGNVIVMTKNGTGTQTFSGGGINYTGNTTVNGGTLELRDTAGWASSIVNQATVELESTAGNWNLGSGRTLSGAGTWNKTGAGTVSLWNSIITASGQINIQQGTLRNDGNSVNWSGSTANVNISPGAILDIRADSVSVNQLSGVGQIINSYGGGGGVTDFLTVGVANGTSTYSGVIAGSGDGQFGENRGRTGLVKIGTGTFSVDGASSNTYAGLTRIENGTMVLGKTGGAVAISGPVQMGNGAVNQPNLRMAQNEQFAPGVVINFANPSGQWARFDLLGTTQTLAGITTGNLTTQGSGVVQNGGLGVGAAGPATLTLNGSGSYIFNGHMRNQDNVASGVLNLVKNGTGTQTLVGGVITHTGQTTVNGGVLELINTTGWASNIANNATVELESTAGNWNVGNGRTLSGGGTWNKTGAGTVSLLQSVITASGQINVQQGTLRNDGNSVNWSGSTVDLDISPVAIFDMRADSVWVDRLTGSGTINNSYGGGPTPVVDTLTVGVSGSSSTFDGVIHGAGDGVFGEGRGRTGLTKMGAGTQVLNGDNTYAGPTNVNAGTLVINGTTFGQGDYNVASGARLGGNGNIGLAPGAAVNVSAFPGEVSPGGASLPYTPPAVPSGYTGQAFDATYSAGLDPATVGTLSITGDVNMGGELLIDLISTSLHDVLDVDGTFQIGSGADLEINGETDFTQLDFFFDLGFDYGDRVDLVLADQIVGNFSNVLANAEFEDARGHAIYFGNDGTSLYLQLVPEPASLVIWSLLGLGLSGLCYRQLRGKSQRA
jgi:autotransporter-associated beta strand protein